MPAELFMTLVVILAGVGIITMVYYRAWREEQKPYALFCTVCGKAIERHSRVTAHDPQTGEVTATKRWVQCPDYLPSRHEYEGSNGHYFRWGWPEETHP